MSIPKNRNLSKKFLSLWEAVIVYGIGRTSLYKLIHEGVIKTYRPGGRKALVKASEMEDYIESTKIETTNIREM